MKNWMTLILCLLTIGAFAQSGAPVTIQANLDWETPIDVKNQQIYPFKDAVWNVKHPTLPLFTQQFDLSAYGDLNVEITDVVFEPFQKEAHEDDQLLSAQLDIQSFVRIARRQPIGEIQFIPIRKTLTGYERVKSIELKITVNPAPMPLGKAKKTGSNSVLTDGNIYKIATTQTGVHRLTYDFLKNEVGIDIDNIDPKTIKIYGNGGGMLPEQNGTARIDDLAENAIQVIGEGDGSFDANDYILFYAEGQDEWRYDIANQRFFYKTNLYATQNYYFIKVSSSNGKRIAAATPLSGATYTTSTFSGRAHYEKDELNLLDRYVYSSASGKEWYGESFKFTTSRDFQFKFPNLVTNEQVSATVRVVGRAINTNNAFTISANGQNIGAINNPGVNGDTESYYARIGVETFPFLSTSDNIDINLNYSKPTSDSEGWLDYITLNTRQNLIFSSGQMSFRDIRAIGESVTQFEITSSNSNVSIWDISDATTAANVSYTTNGNQLTFAGNTSDLHEFIAFDGSNFLTAEFVEVVPNQNLHGGVVAPDLVIVYHKDFVDEAKRLATHRSSHSNMTVATIELGQIYNEFSSGKEDVSAIRDFSKYLYEQYPNFNYLLLFGDGSFDYRNINGSANPQNLIPVYETQASNHPIVAFTSDDYFSLLDPTEGSISTGAMDIGVGRLPIRTVEEAKAVVDKIIKYDTNPVLLGDWKNRITFVADDEDSNLHMNDADQIANMTWGNNPVLNIDKIYLDAYPQVSTHGGTRYPTVTEAIHTNMYKGNFVVNYMGHGGEEGWAQERILQIPHIQSWQNDNKLPLFVTATCSFAPYDDPSLNSAGEIILLKPDGGAIALFTTVRAVYTSSNKKLTTAVFQNLFKKVNGVIPPIGEILRHSKNSSGAGVNNSRKFALLGDPSQTLAYPNYQVLTSTLNGQPITATDTIKAMQQVTIAGYIANPDSSVVAGFNGIIYPTVYDKRQNYQTLGQDAGSSVRDYVLQKTVLFKGRASVTNGQFQFSFIIPKDINYEFGLGKISYYADNGSDLDAAGHFDDIVIGGTNDAALADDEGPQVKVYMNTEEFVFGGMTDESPTLLVKLEDDNGINTSGTGIGHDLTGVLDENTQGTYVLNDFYESELDNFKKGEVRYPLSNLEEGRHQVTVKAWDIANNSGEGSTEFVVASSADVALDHVLNYPNPFTTSTEFQFEHNLPNQPLIVQVQIFSVSGNLVKTIQENVTPDGYRVTGIKWDGTDDFGNRIGRGVYVYKVSVGMETNDGNISSESQFEKLVILK